MERLPLPKLSTLNGDVLRAGDCNHPVCQDCTASFVVARVQEQRVFGIRCPFEGCQNELYEPDIENLVQRGALAGDFGKRLSDLRKQDYTARLLDLTDEGREHTAEDYKLMRRLWTSTRRCPRCNVIIEKSEGCNSFGCTCGHRFNFLKAPRGCGDGIEDFDSVMALAGDFQMTMQTAMQCMQEANKAGIKKYKRVLVHSSRMQIPLSLAEVYVRASLGQGPALAQLQDARVARRLDKKARRLMALMGIPFEDAMQLLQQAHAGDQTAQVKIQGARQLQDSMVTKEATHCVEALEKDGREMNTTNENASSDAEFGQPSIDSAFHGA